LQRVSPFGEGVPPGELRPEGFAQDGHARVVAELLRVSFSDSEAGGGPRVDVTQKARAGGYVVRRALAVRVHHRPALRGGDALAVERREPAPARHLLGAGDVGVVSRRDVRPQAGLDGGSPGARPPVLVLLAFAAVGPARRGDAD